MKILLTGATGYIGKRILPVLIKNGHTVVCCVRDKNRFNPPKSFLSKLEIIEVDLLKEYTLNNIPQDIDAAIELRAPEWFESESIKNEWHQLFLENNIIPVLTDTPGRRDVLHFRVVNRHLFVRFVGNVGTTIDEIRINNWAQRIIDMTDQGITDVWFYAHVPGESREDVVPFNNQLISAINKKSSFNIPLLKDYRSSVLF